MKLTPKPHKKKPTKTNLTLVVLLILPILGFIIGINTNYFLKSSRVPTSKSAYGKTDRDFSPRSYNSIVNNFRESESREQKDISGTVIFKYPQKYYLQKIKNTHSQQSENFYISVNQDPKIMDAINKYAKCIENPDESGLCMEGSFIADLDIEVGTITPQNGTVFPEDNDKYCDRDLWNDTPDKIVYSCISFNFANYPIPKYVFYTKNKFMTITAEEYHTTSDGIKAIGDSFMNSNH